MKKNFLLFTCIILSITKGSAQYYNSAFGLNGVQLKTELHNIIKNHTTVTYADLWNAFQQTDKKLDGSVWDIYTDVPGGVPSVTFQFVTDQCGNYTAEGDCYNREHTWPKEKFGGDNAYPMYSDLHQIYPTDGWVNNKRAAYPYGIVTNVSYTSQSNGSKLGTGSTYPGYADKIFEPVDSFKGDLARTYFYMSTRYESEDAGWDNWAMANGAELTQDAITLLLAWHHNDPVSQKEIDRNNAAALIQNNRNPFIDYPMFADCIWGGGDCTGIGLTENYPDKNISVYPVPAQDYLMLKHTNPVTVYKAFIIDITGREVFQQELHDQLERIYTATLPYGNYLLLINTSHGIFKKAFSKN